MSPAIDMRESRQTQNTLSVEPGALGVLLDSRRRVRMGSLKAAHRLDGTIADLRALLLDAELALDLLKSEGLDDRLFAVRLRTSLAKVRGVAA